MQKRFFKSLALGLVLASAVSVLAACSKSSSGTLTVGIDATYPPMEFIDTKDGKTPIGFDVDMAGEIAKKLGKSVKFEVVDWDGIIAGLKGKRYDIIMSSMNITDERQKEVDFVEYAQMAQVFVTKPGSAIKTENDLAGKKVVVQAETTSDEWVNNLKKDKIKDLQITSFKAATDCFLELKNGRADVVVIDEPVGKYYAKIEPSSYAVTGQAMKPEPVGIAIRKEDSALKSSIDKAVKDLQADGTFKKVSEKWFGSELGK